MFFRLLLDLLVAAITITQVHALPHGEAVELRQVSRDVTISQTVPVQLNKRYKFDTIYCGCGFDMNNQNTDAAVQDLKNQLNSEFIDGIPGTEIVSSIVGDVVAFICNRATGSVKLTAEDYRQELIEITNACGHYIAGTYYEVDYFTPGVSVTEWSAGHMRWSPGVDFCGDADSSPSHSC